MNTAIYYPHFYPSATWLRLAALLWDRVYTMQLRDTPPPPDDLTALNESLGGVWAIAHPFDEMATISEETSVLAETGPERWDKVLEVEMVQKFARWLDFRSERLREQMTASSDLGILNGLTALPRGKVSGPVEELLYSRDLLRREGQKVKSRSRNGKYQNSSIGESRGHTSRYSQKPVQLTKNI